MIIDYSLLCEKALHIGKQSLELQTVSDKFGILKDKILQYDIYRILENDLKEISGELSEYVEMLYKIKMILCDIAEIYRKTEEDLSNSLYMPDNIEKVDFPIVNELEELPEIPFG